MFRCLSHKASDVWKHAFKVCHFGVGQIRARQTALHRAPQIRLGQSRHRRIDRRQSIRQRAAGGAFDIGLGAWLQTAAMRRARVSRFGERTTPA